MKNLMLKELQQVSGGAATQESTKIQDGYLKTTLQIPPHDLEQTIDVYLELQKPR